MLCAYCGLLMPAESWLKFGATGYEAEDSKGDLANELVDFPQIGSTILGI